jgi:hypothetical protein
MAAVIEILWLPPEPNDALARTLVIDIHDVAEHTVPEIASFCV